MPGLPIARAVSHLSGTSCVNPAVGSLSSLSCPGPEVSSQLPDLPLSLFAEEDSDSDPLQVRRPSPYRAAGAHFLPPRNRLRAMPPILPHALHCVQVRIEDATICQGFVACARIVVYCLYRGGTIVFPHRHSPRSPAAAFAGWGCGRVRRGDSCGCIVPRADSRPASCAPHTAPGPKDMSRSSGQARDASQMRGLICAV